MALDPGGHDSSGPHWMPTPPSPLSTVIVFASTKPDEVEMESNKYSRRRGRDDVDLTDEGSLIMNKLK